MMANLFIRSASTLSILRRALPIFSPQAQHPSLSRFHPLAQSLYFPHFQASFPPAGCDPGGRRRPLSHFKFSKWTSGVHFTIQDSAERQLGTRLMSSTSSKGGQAGSSMDAIDEFNQELEFVFGSSLPNTESDSVSDPVSPIVQPSMPLFTPPSPTSSVAPRGTTDMLTHVDAQGKASMVNVSNKSDTERVAVATGRVSLGPKAFEMVKSNQIAKGDVLTVAQIAGIQGAKLTSNLIPLCHNILLAEVNVALHLHEESHSVDIEARARAVGPTGVEMEALTAVTVSALTVYDMCKAVSKDIEIQQIGLKSKTGGKSGDWHRKSLGDVESQDGALCQQPMINKSVLGDLREDSSWEPQFGHAR